jgi:hypothetical protein
MVYEAEIAIHLTHGRHAAFETRARDLALVPRSRNERLSDPLDQVFSKLSAELERELVTLLAAE